VKLSEHDASALHAGGSGAAEQLSKDSSCAIAVSNPAADSPPSAPRLPVSSAILLLKSNAL
jgi:hypothetical protein